MRGIRVLLVVTVVLATLGAQAATDASAAVQLGSTCMADGSTGNQIIFEPATSTAPFNGVITSSLTPGRDDSS
jgi:hypothetical protein